MKHLGKHYFGLLAIGAALLVSTGAAAQSRITHVSDVQYRGELTYTNAGYTLDFAQSHESGLKGIIEQAREISELKSNLRVQLRQSLEDAISDYGELEIFLFDIEGPIVVELTGNTNGTITARVGGFSVHAYGTVEGTGVWGAIGAEGSATVNTNTLWLTGNYSIVTGKITNLTPVGFVIDADIDIDWILDWVPVLHLLTDYFENDILSSARNDVAEAINTAIDEQQDKTFFNLNDAIPDNTFMLGDFDAGQELRDLAFGLFTDLVSNESFRLEITDEVMNYNAVAPLYPNPNINPAYTTLAASYTKHTVSLNISDHFFLDIREIPHFTVTSNPYCSWVYCPIPPNTDLANTPENPTDITIVNPDGDVITIPYGLSFDFESLHLLFAANPPPPPNPFSSGEVVASGGSYGNFTHSLCSWEIVTGVSGARDLMCNGSLVARRRVVTNYGTYTIVTLADSANFTMVGSYPNYRISAK